MWSAALHQWQDELCRKRVTLKSINAIMNEKFVFLVSYSILLEKRNEIIKQ